MVPLVKKLDKRTNTERFTISKKQYIKDNIHLSELQDVYNLRLREAGFELERGIKNSDRKHIKIQEFKKTARYYEDKVTTINKNLDNAMNDFEEKMKTTKSTIIDKEYVRVRKDTFDSMNNVIKETKVNKAFSCLVENLIQEEYKPFGTTIISKTTSFVPLDLMICPTYEWVFVTEKEYHHLMEEENISKIKNGIDNNKELVEKISKKIVADYKSNNLHKKNILEIISNYIPQKKLLDIDSKVITYMIESIVFNIEETYQVLSINPFVIEGL